MNTFLLYFLLQLDSLNRLFLTMSIVIGFFIAVFVVVYLASSEDRDDNLSSASLQFLTMKKIWVGFAVFTILTIIMPSTKNAVIVYALPKIMSNQHVQQIPSNFVNIIDLKMKGWLKTIEKDLIDKGVKDK